MKIGISTFHFVQNNGAMLQCWALQEKLNEMGNETYVLDYRPAYHVNMYSAWRNPLLVSGLKNKIKTMLLNYRYFERKKKESKFKMFERNYCLTDEVRDLNSWYKIAPETFDAIFCGSDQIWNKKITNGTFDSAYFANISGFKGRKIAYAVSVGETNLDENKQELYDLIKDFSAISTREKQTEEKLNFLFPDMKISTVPDPTLLLEKEKYEHLMVDPDITEQYILVYKLEDNPRLIDVCKKLVRETGLKIVNISPTKITSLSDVIWKADVTPGEFVSYIARAAYVVTNSFHGSVFSLLFNKKVVIVPHSKRNDRLKNLVDILGAEQCMLHNDNISEVLCFNLDYDRINNKISHYRNLGESYIRKALE